MSLYDSDVYRCYNDLWKTAQERKNVQYQGIDEPDNRNTARIRVSAGNKDTSIAVDKAIADAYSNRFYIPLDFDLLESHAVLSERAQGPPRVWIHLQRKQPRDLGHGWYRRLLRHREHQLGVWHGDPARADPHD